jgi:hypothetical protein
MNLKTDRGPSRLSAETAPKKRFRIVKPEERIAPGNSGNGNSGNRTGKLSRAW